MSQYVYLDEYTHTHTHTHTHSFLLHTKPQKRITGSHIHVCAFQYLLPVFQMFCQLYVIKQHTKCFFISLPMFVKDTMNKGKKTINTCENISAETLTQFNFLKCSCDYPLFISQLTRYLSNCQRILFSHGRENKQASSLLCFLSGH